MVALAVGLHWSEVVVAREVPEGAMSLGDSLLSAWIGELVVGDLPAGPFYGDLGLCCGVKAEMQWTGLTASMSATDDRPLHIAVDDYARTDRMAIAAWLYERDRKPMTGIWGFVAVNFQWRAAVQHQYIQPAITIEICKRCTARPFRTGQPGALTHFSKGPIRLLHQEIIGIFDRIGRHLIHIAFGDEQIGAPVIVQIAKLRMPAR